MNQVYEAILLIPNAILTWGTFIGAGILAVLYGIFRNSRPISFKEMVRTCIPFNPVTSKSVHGDIKSAILLKIFKVFIFTQEAIFTSSVAFATCSLIEYFVGSATGGIKGYGSYLIPVLLMTIVLEFSYYMNHYLHHKVPCLWELHKVHHSANILTPLTDLRGHVLSHAIRAAIVAVIAGIPAGSLAYSYAVEIPQLVLLSGLSIHVLRYATLYPLKHSHFPIGFGPLDWIIQSPHMHQVHHSVELHHRDKNLGVNLSVFDWMFGTGYRPAKGETLTFGLGQGDDADREKFDSLRGLLVEPLRDSMLALQNSIRKQDDQRLDESEPALVQSQIVGEEAKRVRESNDGCACP